LVVAGAPAETKAPRERRLMMEFHNNILDIMVVRSIDARRKCRNAFPLFKNHKKHDHPHDQERLRVGH
jgi:hypothetical protein